MSKKVKEHKTIEERIERIYSMAEDHFGGVRFVGIKKEHRVGWVVKAKFYERESLIAEGEDLDEALKKLRKRLRKIIDRYNMV